MLSAMRAFCFAEKVQPLTELIIWKYLRIIEVSIFDEGTFKLYSKPYFSFFRGGTKLALPEKGSALFFFQEPCTVTEKTIIKSLERGSG